MQNLILTDDGYQYRLAKKTGVRILHQGLILNVVLEDYGPISASPEIYREIENGARSVSTV